MTTGNKALTLPVIQKVKVQTDRQENINEQRSRAIEKYRYRNTLKESYSYRCQAVA